VGSFLWAKQPEREADRSPPYCGIHYLTLGDKSSFTFAIIIIVIVNDC
jgi:hypothetical protein